METFAADFALALATHDAVTDVDALVFESLDGEEEKVSHPNVDLTRCDAEGTFSRLESGIRWGIGSEFDVVHSLTLYPSGLIATVLRQILTIERTFVTVHGTDALSVADDPIHGRIRKFTLQHNGVICLSESTRSKVATAYSTDLDDKVIPPGVPSLPDPAADVELPDTGGRFTVLTVTRLVERKGIGDLIDAVESLPDVSLWIVGDGPKRTDFQRRCDRYGITDRVTFVGTVGEAELVSYYDAADLFCLPSRHVKSAGDVEGLGLVFLEAQRRGLPVLGTDSGGIPEAISDGETGFVVEERNPEALRDGIRRIAESPERQSAFADAAPAFIERQFTWEQCVERHLNAYRGSSDTTAV
jgi:phosphatidylinositol alpha-1,6-mannosyltransferase